MCSLFGYSLGAVGGGAGTSEEDEEIQLRPYVACEA